jgi:hypothetical protein
MAGERRIVIMEQKQEVLISAVMELKTISANLTSGQTAQNEQIAKTAIVLDLLYKQFEEHRKGR